MAPPSALFSDFQGVLLSISVFVGTAWLCSRHRLQRDDEDLSVSDDLSTSSNSGSDEGWEQRRLRHRLSFHDFQKADEQTRLDGEDEASFYPKNSNWDHFERFHESERRKTIQIKQSLDGEFLSSNEKGASGEGTTSEDDDSVSLASKSHFVWTDNPKYWQSSHKYSSYSRQPSNNGLEPIPSENQLHITTPQPPSTSAGIRPLAKTDRSVSLDDRQMHRALADGTRPNLQRSRSIDNCEGRSLPSVVREQNRSARKSYNARIMPDKVILVRHGQSMGNISEDLYSTVPDNAMPLTKLGFEQARAAGQQLRQQLTGSVHFVVSPYVRTVETFHGIVSAWCEPQKEFGHIADRDFRLKAWYSRLLDMGITWHEDPRIREQDFGNYQDSEKIRAAKRERHRFGAFYYRFAHGESASDVFDRISTFLDSLWRSFDTNKSQNYVIITHGIAIRVLLARYFRYSVNQFHFLSNPRNCEMVVLNHDAQGRLRMGGRHELELEYDSDQDEAPRVLGYQYHKRLRVLPKEHVKTAKIRISFDDDEYFLLH